MEDITRWREDMNFMFEWQELHVLEFVSQKKIKNQINFVCIGSHIFGRVLQKPEIHLCLQAPCWTSQTLKGVSLSSANHDSPIQYHFHLAGN